MIVESVWKVLKRKDLAMFNRPRLDWVTHVVLTKIIPRVQSHLAHLRGDCRKGRPQALAEWQKDLKHDWVDMSRVDEHRSLEKELEWRRKPLNTKGRAERLADIESERLRPRGEYHTSTKKWTCSCPAYLISRFLLCKHLVRKANSKLQLVATQELMFFGTFQRRHYPPYYEIPGLHVKGRGGTPIELDAIEVVDLRDIVSIEDKVTDTALIQEEVCDSDSQQVNCSEEGPFEREPTPLNRGNEAGSALSPSSQSSSQPGILETRVCCKISHRVLPLI